MKHREDVLIECPYYKWEERQKIVCEGVQKGTAIHLTFDTNPKLKYYKNCFCKKDYNRCLLADMHNIKWDYDA